MRRLRVLAAFIAIACVTSRAAAQEDVAAARAHYDSGLKLFEAGQNEQALVEFQQAWSLKPRPAVLFMIAQCEYTLGQLEQARLHYQQYIGDNAGGEFIDVARYRIDAIDKRPSVLVINTVPEQVTVQIEGVEGIAAGVQRTGEAPNSFSVPHGRHRVSLTKPGYVSQTRMVQLGVAEAKVLFVKLDPVPARLEIETDPAGATLYVNGNRARNPYRQDVPAGSYELFAEAKDHASRTETVALGPGGKRLFTGPGVFSLPYVQRSGALELWAASAIAGGLVGAGGVAAIIGPSIYDRDAHVSTSYFIGGGATAGVITGLLTANALVPRYIPDNRALFVIGGMWMGALDGALAGVAIAQATAPVERDPAGGPVRTPPGASTLFRAAFLGGLPGLALGTTASALLSNRAPSHGRVALVQSAAAGGLLAGWLAGTALQLRPASWQQNDASGAVVDAEPRVLDGALPALVGLNLGLAGGLMATLGGDRSSPGPSWQRVALVDIAVGAGALAGSIAGCAAQDRCLEVETATRGTRAAVASLALAGGAAGLLAGVLLTRNMDRDAGASTGPGLRITVAPMPTPTEGLRPSLLVGGPF